MTRLYFVVLNEMLAEVVHSQVVAAARAFAGALPQLSARIVFLEPARVAASRRARERLAGLRRAWPEGSISLCPYVGRLGKYSPAVFLETLIRATRGPKGRIILHCRGSEATIQATHVAARLGGRVVFDCRGATDHEAVLRLTAQGRGDDSALIERAFREGGLRDRLAAEKADGILAVSEPLASRLRQGLGPQQKPVKVVPCCLERPLFSLAARAQKRRDLFVGNDELLLVHTSTAARWEAFNEVIGFFRAISRYRPVRLLFLTTLGSDLVTASLNPDDALRGRISVRQALPDEVPHFLSAADVGIQLRRPHEAHLFASPIKFSEYLGAGLAIVVSEGVGTTAEVVRNESVGVVLPCSPAGLDYEEAAQRLLTLLEAGPETTRRRSISACERSYLWEGYVPAVSEAYGLS